MRKRRSIIALVVMVAAAGLVVAGIAVASRSTRVSFEFTPSSAPRHMYAPGAIHVHLRTAVPPRTRASRIRFDFDDHFRFAPGAVPTCPLGDISGQVDMATAMERCGSANIGGGTAKATTGTTTFEPCVLAFNGPPEEGLPTVLLFVRVEFSPPVADCSNPASNHSGNLTLIIKGFLGRSPLDGYRRKLTFNRLNQVESFPLTDLDLTLQGDRYVGARCASGDSRGGWQLRTKVGYVKPRRVEVVETSQRCRPLRAERASLEAAGLRE